MNRWVRAEWACSGWEDAGGNVWVPTGPGSLAHGGPHWDNKRSPASTSAINQHGYLWFSGG